MQARAQKLSPEDVSGGTITLSNIGAIGGTYAAPILMPRESVIAGMLTKVFYHSYIRTHILEPLL